jgi:hypothetical protein
VLSTDRLLAVAAGWQRRSEAFSHPLDSSIIKNTYACVPRGIRKRQRRSEIHEPRRGLGKINLGNHLESRCRAVPPDSVVFRALQRGYGNLTATKQRCVADAYRFVPRRSIVLTQRQVPDLTAALFLRGALDDES